VEQVIQIQKHIYSTSEAFQNYVHTRIKFACTDFNRKLRRSVVSPLRGWHCCSRSEVCNTPSLTVRAEVREVDDKVESMCEHQETAVFLFSRKIKQE
jgi:hypothetical protein